MDTDYVRVKFPEYLLPLLRRSNKVLALKFYLSQEWDRLFQDPNFTDKEKLDISFYVFQEASKYGLRISFEEFTQIRNLPNHKDIGDLNWTVVAKMTDNVLATKLDSLDKLIKKYDHPKQEFLEMPIIPKNSGNNFKFRNTEELYQDNELLNQINISNDIKPEHKCIKLENENFQILDKQSRIGVKRSYKDIELEEEKEENEADEAENTESNDEEINPMKYKKKVKIRYSDAMWNEIDKYSGNKFYYDILILKEDLEIENLLELNLPSVHAIIGNTISNDCSKLFKDAKVYEGSELDMIACKKYNKPLEILDMPNFLPNILIYEKKWKIFRLLTTNKIPRLEMEIYDEIKPKKYPIFQFEAMDLNF